MQGCPSETRLRLCLGRTEARPRPAEVALIGAGTYLAGLGAIISYVSGVGPRLEPWKRHVVLERKSDRLNPA